MAEAPSHKRSLFARTPQPKILACRAGPPRWAAAQRSARSRVGTAVPGGDRTAADRPPLKILNPNVLIEIGGAMALYGRKFILLVEKGVSLPSNLQGLYEVRYEGDRLDYEATMRLLKAFKRL